MRILLAEDNKINQKYAQALLEKRFHLTIAENGVQAVDQMRRHDFDVVLMDIQMPVLDGVGATQRIRALAAPQSRVPILALTADAIAGAEERYLAAGMDAYLAKPITPASLQTALARLAGRAREVETVAPLPAPSTAPSALDSGVVAELRRIFSPVQLDAFLADALEDIPQRIERLAAQLEAGDLAMAAREAHDLVSLIGNCGARAASALARSVEQGCRAGDRQVATERYQAFHVAAAAALRELSALRQPVA